MYVTIARVAMQQTYVRIVETVVPVYLQLALLHERVQLLKTITMFTCTIMLSFTKDRTIEFKSIVA